MQICLHSLVVSWLVPKGVTFCMLSQGGRTLSPFSARPWTGEVSGGSVTVGTDRDEELMLAHSGARG